MVQTTFRKNAEACFNLAQATSHEGDRAHWLSMAQYWLDRARDAEAGQTELLPGPPAPAEQPAQQQQQQVQRKDQTDD